MKTFASVSPLWLNSIQKSTFSYLLRRLEDLAVEITEILD